MSRAPARDPKKGTSKNGKKMASISNDGRGFRRIQFFSTDGKRLSIRLGKTSQRSADAIRVRVEQLLECRRFGRPMDADLQAWVLDLDQQVAGKLHHVGLIALPESDPKETLGHWLDSWLARRRPDYKRASVLAWGQVVAALKKHFGENCDLVSIDRGKAESFRQAMVASGRLRPTTIHKRLQHARLFFEDAKRDHLIVENPFEHVRHRPGDPAERRAYVTVDHVLRAIEACPNSSWRLLLALSRFGGLRVPSEALSLRWADVLWAENRLCVPSPKTEHLAGRGYRVIPLFKSLRPFLDRQWEESPEGAIYVFPEEYRLRAQGTGGWAGCNLRSNLLKILRRAGLGPWPRLWHSMRASAQTDLAARHPLPTVCRWLGNSQAVAMRHYVDVTDADFERALEWVEPEAVQKAAQQTHATGGSDSQAFIHENKKTPDLPGFSKPCESVQGSKVEAAGIEPASRDPSTDASTCLVVRF